LAGISKDNCIGALQTPHSKARKTTRCLGEIYCFPPVLAPSEPALMSDARFVRTADTQYVRANRRAAKLLDWELPPERWEMGD